MLRWTSREGVLWAVKSFVWRSGERHRGYDNPHISINKPPSQGKWACFDLGGSSLLNYPDHSLLPTQIKGESSIFTSDCPWMSQASGACGGWLVLVVCNTLGLPAIANPAPMARGWGFLKLLLRTREEEDKHPRRLKEFHCVIFVL